MSNYSDLIVPKAHRVFGKFMPDALYSSISDEKKKEIANIVGNNAENVIVVFYEQSSISTILTDKKITSFFDGLINSVDLNDITSNYQVYDDRGDDSEKTSLNRVKFLSSGAVVRTPSAAHLSLLLNSLQGVMRKNSRS